MGLRQPRLSNLAFRYLFYLTACTDIETLERAKLTEPEGYISKPFKKEGLYNEIKMALHKNRSKRVDEGK
jgi:AmiR/NasT family two-component response regulator